jgi:excisionase family DNA binding protein
VKHPPSTSSDGAVTRMKHEMPAGVEQPPSTTDTAWLTKPEALRMLQVSERSLDRLVTRGKVQKQTRPRPGRTPEPVYNRADIERITAVDAFPIPDSGGRELATSPIPTPGVTAAFAQALAIIEGARSTARQPAPPALWCDLETASWQTGLSIRLLRRMIVSGVLPALRDGRAWKICRSDLHAIRANRATIDTLARTAGEGGKP